GTHRNMGICAYVESKCVYPNGQHKEPILKLARQLQREAEGKILNVPRIGLVFSCWSIYYAIDPRAFQESIDESIANSFDPHRCERMERHALTSRFILNWQTDVVEIEVCLHPITIFPQQAPF
ncbi:MAG TPA: hypothetical protein VF624_12855, partial [Tepidisphaeraceae bacterium]